jgi:hypothetical protein
MVNSIAMESLSKQYVMHLAILPHHRFYVSEEQVMVKPFMAQRHTIWWSSYQMDFTLWLTMPIACLPLFLFFIGDG